MRKSEVTNIADKIGGTVDDVTDKVNDARELARGWAKRARRLAQERPGAVLVGAVALGFVLAKVARHA
jgi:hypothetical protein